MKKADMETQLRVMAADKQKRPGSHYACKKCWGSGRTGYKDGVPVPCKCTGTTIREIQ